MSETNDVGCITCGRDNRNGTHSALELTGHLSHPFIPWRSPTSVVLEEVAAERDSQDAKWGEQNHPDGTGPDLVLMGYPAHPYSGAALARDVEAWARARCQAAEQQGGDTYERILTEEWAEAIACDDPGKLREELLQVAAVAVAWVEKLDREAGGGGAA